MKPPKCKVCGYEHPLGAPHILVDATPKPERGPTPVPKPDLLVAVVEAITAFKKARGDAVTAATPSEIKAVMEDYKRLKLAEAEGRAKQAARMRRYRRGLAAKRDGQKAESAER